MMWLSHHSLISSHHSLSSPPSLDLSHVDSDSPPLSIPIPIRHGRRASMGHIHIRPEEEKEYEQGNEMR